MLSADCRGERRLLEIKMGVEVQLIQPFQFRNCFQAVIMACPLPLHT